MDVEISLTIILERKKKEQINGRKNRRRPISIPGYNLSLQTCIPNMKFLSLMVVEISLTKNLERKKKDKQKKEQIGEGPFSIPRYNLSL